MDRREVDRAQRLERGYFIRKRRSACPRVTHGKAEKARTLDRSPPVRRSRMARKLRSKGVEIQERLRDWRRNASGTKRQAEKGKHVISAQAKKKETGGVRPLGVPHRAPI